MEIVDSAKSVSLQYKNAEITYENSLLTQAQNALEDELKVTVSTGTVEIIPASVTNGSNIAFTPSVEVTLADDGDTTIALSSGFAYNFQDSSYYSYTPSVVASHTFDLTGYDEDYSSDLSASYSALSSELTWRETQLAFETQILNYLDTLLTYEQTLRANEKMLEDYQKELADALELGTYTTDSVSYKQLVNTIDYTKNTIDAQKKRIDTASEQYKVATGLVWDGVTALPEPDLNFLPLPSGNTNVVLASLEVDIAKDAYDKEYASTHPASVKLSGGLTGGAISASAGLSSGKSEYFGGNANVSFSDSNWSVSAGTELVYSFSESKLAPSITLAGSWTNKTTKKSEDLALQKLANAYIVAQNDYQDELTNYFQDAQNIENSILEYEYKAEQQKAQEEYLKAELEYQRLLFDGGLATAKAVSDAEFELEQAEYDRVLLIIEGLILTNEIKTLNL